jgi:predicted metal-dependent hydrolase
LATKKFIINNLGEIPFIKSRKSKRLSIKIAPYKGVRVTIPYNVSYNKAIEFVSLKTKWIINNLKKVKDFEESNLQQYQNNQFVTKFHKLNILKDNYREISSSVRNNKIIIKIPSDIDENNDQIKNVINKNIKIALKKEAKSYISERLKELSVQNNLKYNKLRFSSAKTRWGSCTSINNINISIYIMTLPFHLIDYVLLHELAHTKIKNHSKNFWHYLDLMTDGKSQNLRQEIRKLHIPYLN